MAVGIGHRWAGFPISGTLVVMESRQPSDRKRARTRRPSLSDPSRRTTDGLRNPSEVSAWHSSGCYGTNGQRTESESTGRSLAFEQEPMRSLTSPYPRTATGQDGCPCHGCGQHRPCLLERTFSAANSVESPSGSVTAWNFWRLGPNACGKRRQLTSAALWRS
jgi:hypothetical protein